MTKKNSGTTFNFKGEVEVKGDIVGGDKIVHNYGGNIVNIKTPAQFISALQNLRRDIAALKARTDLSPAQESDLKFVEAKIIEVEEKAAKAEVNGEEISKTLDDAKTMMDSIASAITSAVGLGTLLGQLASMAIQIFSKVKTERGRENDRLSI